MAADSLNPAADGMQPDGQEQFGIQKVYVKDLSFEAPNAPQIFMTQSPMNPRPRNWNYRTAPARFQKVYTKS
ncbi:MAG: protein-export chaperone SecB [Thiotrichaceae bacterium]